MTSPIISRREFVTGAATVAVGTILLGPNRLFSTVPVPDVSVVRGGTAAATTRRALEILGGMNRYVSTGDIVVVKPNIGWDTRIGLGADTNPEVVKEVIKMCFEAGAKKVKVFDNPCNEPRRCYQSSGIEEAAESANAEVEFMNENRYDQIDFPNGIRLKSWPVYRDALPDHRDKLINIPVLKHHSLPKTRSGKPGISIGFKNMMGVMGGNRGQIHNGWEDNIVDFCTVMKADLTIVDATNVLMRNGPRGGRLADVEKMDTIIAGADMVAVDAWGVKTFGYEPNDLIYLVQANRRGLGQIDLSHVVTIEERLS
jgi:uncharacterized protein (DUF362 family)